MTGQGTAPPATMNGKRATNTEHTITTAKQNVYFYCKCRHRRKQMTNQTDFDTLDAITKELINQAGNKEFNLFQAQRWIAQRLNRFGGVENTCKYYLEII